MESIKKILLPVDFSERSEKLIDSAKSMAKTYKANLVIVYVAGDFTPYTGFTVPQISIELLEEGVLRDAEDKMDGFLNKHFVGIDYCEGKVLNGNPAEEIIKYAEEQDIDLIVMGTHGYRGVEKMLLGSVAEKVVKMSPCPVLTINTMK